MKFSRSNFKMQRFESRSPRLEVLANFDSGMRRFESRRPSQRVRLQRVTYSVCEIRPRTQCVTWVLFLVYQTADFEPETISLPCDVGGAA